jgi:tryptophan synthase alpha chain
MKKKVSIFITAGFPSIESTIEQIIMLQEAGVDFIELGIPFSDPMADGPVIQETSKIALEQGMNLTLLFDLLAKHQHKIKIPLVMMGYFNPIFLMGVEQFLRRCQEIGIKLCVIPDLSMEVYEKHYKNMFEQYNVTPCFLVSPMTTNERVIKAAELSQNGFVYLVSQNSITGENKVVSTELEKRYFEIKDLFGSTYMMIGFGIKDQMDVARAHRFADGAIIGTAYLKALMNNCEKSFVESILCN